ncbi:MAG: LD-carboxypeptidase [Flavobacteriales bacterium]|nr:LD-carboxypeptidase [Flavobacteriales bacterium]
MIIPKTLKKGDKVSIISTARKITMQELIPSIKILKSWGLEVVFGENLFKENNQFSGTKKQRVEDLQNAINDNSISAILCARGGYGTVQIIDDINFSNLKKNPKWIIGYSDVTVLHSHLHNVGIATLHASMPINFVKNTEESLNSLKNILFEGKNTIEYNSQKINNIGNVNSEIVGGNLSILYSLIGSDSDINTNGKILFIEDLDEYLYHIDRMMINLKRNGKLENLAALIVGGMSDMNDNEISFGKSVIEIISECVAEYNYPVCFNFPAGHLDDNRTIIFGQQSELIISEKTISLKQ